MSLAKRHSVMDDLAERLESYFEGGGSLMPRSGRRKSLYEVIVKEPAVYDRNRADHWQLESNERRYIRKLFRALDVDSNGWVELEELEAFIKGNLKMEPFEKELRNLNSSWSIDMGWYGSNEKDDTIVMSLAGSRAVNPRTVKVDEPEKNTCLTANGPGVGPLTPEDFFFIAERTKVEVTKLRKRAFVAAKPQTKAKSSFISYSGGVKESTNEIHAGDYVVTALTDELKLVMSDSGEKNQWVVAGEKFNELYEPDESGGAPTHWTEDMLDDFGEVYRARNVVYAMRFPGGLNITAPWGQNQFFSLPAYLFCSSLTGDVYGCDEKACKETYEEVPKFKGRKDHKATNGENRDEEEILNVVQKLNEEDSNQGQNSTMNTVIRLLVQRAKKAKNNRKPGVALPGPEPAEPKGAFSDVASNQSDKEKWYGSEEDLFTVFEAVKKSQRFPPTPPENLWLEIMNVLMFFLAFPIAGFPVKNRLRNFGWFGFHIGEEKDIISSAKEWVLYLVCLLFYVSLVINLAFADKSPAAQSSGITVGMLVVSVSAYIGVAVTVMSTASKPYRQWTIDFSLLRLLDYIVQLHHQSVSSAVRHLKGNRGRPYFTAYDVFGLVTSKRKRTGEPKAGWWTSRVTSVCQDLGLSKWLSRKTSWPIALGTFSAVLPVIARAVLRHLQSEDDWRTVVYHDSPMGYVGLAAHLIANLILTISMYLVITWLILEYNSYLEQILNFEQITQPNFIGGTHNSLLNLNCPENVEGWRLVRDMILLQNDVYHRQLVFGLAFGLDFILIVLLFFSLFMESCLLADPMECQTGDCTMTYWDTKCKSLSSTDISFIAHGLIITAYIFRILGIVVTINRHLISQVKWLEAQSSNMVSRNPMANNMTLFRMSYDPRPPNLSSIEVPEHVLKLVDMLASNTHDIWAESKLKAGWTWGEQNDHAAKKHMQLIPYDLLSEEEKSYDYLMVLETIRGALALGFRVVQPPKGATLSNNIKVVSVPEGVELPHDYKPQVVDTRGIDLPSELAEVAEVLAEHVHNKWARERMNQGYRWGPKRCDDPEKGKKHPLLMPYECLDEEGKAGNRTQITEILKTLMGLGYKLQRLIVNHSTLFHSNRTKSQMSLNLLQSFIIISEQGSTTLLGITVTDSLRNSVLMFLISGLFGVFLAIITGTG